MRTSEECTVAAGWCAARIRTVYTSSAKRILNHQRRNDPIGNLRRCTPRRA